MAGFNISPETVTPAMSDAPKKMVIGRWSSPEWWLQPPLPTS